MLSGRTNDEVKADPERMWRSDLPAAQASVRLRPPEPAGPTPDELASLDALGNGGSWAVFGRELELTNLDKDAVPGARRRGAGDQAGADPLRRADRPGRAALPGGPAR